MFQGLQDTIKREAVAYVFNASVEVAEQAEEQRQAPPESSGNVRLSSASTEQEARAAQGQGRRQKVGRNQPCWCGSGKKFKACHGAPGVHA